MAKLVKVGETMWLKEAFGMPTAEVKIVAADFERQVATIEILPEYQAGSWDKGQADVPYDELYDKVDLTKVKFGLVEYGGECAITRIDIPAWRMDARVRWTFELIFEIHPSKKGVDGEGHQACGFARAAMITDPPEPTVLYPLVDIGDTVLTPYGKYRVEWYNQTNHDNLRLTEIKRVLSVGQRVWLQGVAGAPGVPPVPPCKAEIIEVGDPLILREVLVDGNLDMKSELIMNEKDVFTEGEWVRTSDFYKVWDPENEPD